MAKSRDDILHPRAAAEAPAEFPNAPPGWTVAAATECAAAEGVELGEDHWEAVRALQEYFAKRHAERISVRELRDGLEERFHARGGTRYLYLLFPGGPVAQGCRIAGLAPPSSSVDKSFGSVQ